MPTDVFNNPSNDYVNPGLSPCANAADDFNFEFLPREEAGITSGSAVIQSLDLSDIIVPITSWTSEKKYISSGEVVYVPGLTKGLNQRSQRFTIPIASPETDQEFFMMLDISINYYRNFRYYNIDIDASGNFGLGLDVANDMNIQLGARSIGAVMSYDTSAFTFGGTTDGYAFNVTNAVLTIIDASMDINSPFDSSIDIWGNNVPAQYTLVEDPSSAVLAAKYPNGAMMGYILKTYFPTTAGDTDKWFYMNNVKSPFIAMESAAFPYEAYYNRVSKQVDVGMNGAGTSDTFSAGEYLDYITTNNLWEKVGDFRAHISSIDPADSAISNLVGGFYIFNPHEFDIQVEYMLIN